MQFRILWLWAFHGFLGAVVAFGEFQNAGRCAQNDRNQSLATRAFVLFAKFAQSSCEMTSFNLTRPNLPSITLYTTDPGL